MFCFWQNPMLTETLRAPAESVAFAASDSGKRSVVEAAAIERALAAVDAALEADATGYGDCAKLRGALRTAAGALAACPRWLTGQAHAAAVSKLRQQVAGVGG